MAYSQELADRIRAIMKRRQGFTEQKMFGGIAFMIHGHMCAGVISDDLMLRLGEEDAAKALEEPYVRSMTFTGPPMKSMVYISSDGCPDAPALRAWLDRACRFVKTLPPKPLPPQPTLRKLPRRPRRKTAGE